MIRRRPPGPHPPPDKMKEKQQILTGLQNQKGNFKLLVEKGELLQHLDWNLRF